ncbi:hypothetical protein [Phenylobacterium sp.]|uniref:hypothetical protein n=1 Tax=Phenylobacterium sp. TaxID=1871053 RepID=UPI00271B9515|nr:hypothetical protein [Phenylobacterium sp.]MDO8378196.1 hypothetical protein [Phenylobacterium sp.]
MVERDATVSAKLDLLLEKICLEWGFCLGPDDAQRIIDMTDIDAEAFATVVLAAEGMVVDREGWKARLKNAFASSLS